MRKINSSLFMNILWYEEVTPEQLCAYLCITEKQFFDKLCGYEDFSLDEIRRISTLIGMTEEEINAVFFPEG